MEELVQANAQIIINYEAIDYEDLAEDCRTRAEDIEEDTGREADLDSVIDDVIEDYFIDLSGVVFTIPDEVTRNIKKKLKEILF